MAQIILPLRILIIGQSLPKLMLSLAICLVMANRILARVMFDKSLFLGTHSFEICLVEFNHQAMRKPKEPHGKNQMGAD